MGSEAAVKVEITSSYSLQPGVSDRIAPVKYELTAIDRGMRFALYQRRILFFTSSFSPEEFSTLVQSLKGSLVEVLTPFHPLCGRIRLGAEDISALELDCSGELSIQFSEARAHLKLEELQADNFQPSELNDCLCEIGCSPKFPWDPQVPLLFVQVTRFSCGGVSIGIAFSHQACDGVSAWQFMNAWAELNRTGKLLNPPEVSYRYDEWKNLSEEEMNESARRAGFNFDLSTATPPEGDSKSEFRQPDPENSKLGVKHFKVEKSTIENLKLQVKMASSRSFTTYEILCAHIWRKMVAAREFSDEDECYLMVLVNCRGRIIKSMPENYFGNAIGSVLVSAKFEDLAGEDKLGAIAQLIHDRIVSHDEATAQGFIAFMNKLMSSNSIRYNPKPGQFTLVVSSPRHPVFECDFGFGRPAGVTFGMNDLGDAKMYLFPPADGAGGVDVTISMAAEDLHKLSMI